LAGSPVSYDHKPDCGSRKGVGVGTVMVMVVMVVVIVVVAASE